jgi:UDP-glucose 4-epimerase
MKKIIVTGGSGFIGSEVVFQLLGKNYEVINLDIKKPKYKSDAIFIKCDLRYEFPNKKILRSPEAIIHLAANIGNARYSLDNPYSMLSDNSLIDLNVAKGAVLTKTKKVIYISSSLVYERSNKFPADEILTDTIPHPKLAYSFEKLFGEQIFTNLHKQIGINYVICRLFNAYGVNSYGLRDKHRHVIEDIFQKLKSGNNELTIIGDGKQKRCFTHVKDLARGIILALENKNAINEILNIGSVKEYEINQIAQLIIKLHFSNRKIKIKHTSNINKDINKNSADSKKALKIIKWKPEISMEKGILEL